jgi:sec-independent protein translocase protein TatA
MPSNFGAPELIIVLVVVLLVFGVGRLSRIGGEMGSAIREFRRGLQGDEPAKKADDKPTEGETDGKS